MTEPTKPASVAVAVRQTLSTPQMMEQLRMALPSHLTPERMVRVAVTAIQKSPKLMQCTQQSLIGCVVEASQLGLETDGVMGLAYLVPFENRKTGRTEAQLMIGYKGLMALARRSGEVSAITAEVVYSKDKFRVIKGLTPDLIHEYSYNGEDRGDMIAFYATAKLANGETVFHDMSIREIEAIRNRSRSSSNGPWVTDYVWMAKKTVIRQLCKLLPMAVEAQSAIAKDEQRDLGILHGDDVIETTAAPTPGKAPQTLDDAAAMDIGATEEQPLGESGGDSELSDLFGADEKQTFKDQG